MIMGNHRTSCTFTMQQISSGGGGVSAPGARRASFLTGAPPVTF